MAVQSLKPRVEMIKARYGDDKAKIQRETNFLYEQAGVNPLAGCLPSLGTIPIFIGLYRSLTNVASEGLLDTQGFYWIPSLAGPTSVAARGTEWLLPLVDGAPPIGWHDASAYLVLPALLVACQYVSSAIVSPPIDPNAENAGTQRALYALLPLMVGWFALNVPSGLGLYYLSNTALTTGVQLWLRKLGGADVQVNELGPITRVGTARRLGAPAGEDGAWAPSAAFVAAVEADAAAAAAAAEAGPMAAVQQQQQQAAAAAAAGDGGGDGAAAAAGAAAPPRRASAGRAGGARRGPPQRRRRRRRRPAAPAEEPPPPPPAPAAPPGARAVGGPPTEIVRISPALLDAGGLDPATQPADALSGFSASLAKGYLPVNLAHPGLRVLNIDPPVITVDGFLPPDACDALVAAAAASGRMAASAVGGAGGPADVRTSSTLALTRDVVAAVPELGPLLDAVLARAGALVGGPGLDCSALAAGAASFARPTSPTQLAPELPQVAHYLPGQHFLAHEDGFPASVALAKGYQRRGTLLVYLNDVPSGGRTRFEHCGVAVAPARGRALLFFPAFSGGMPDARTLHTAEDAEPGAEKFVFQLWLTTALPTRPRVDAAAHAAQQLAAARKGGAGGGGGGGRKKAAGGGKKRR
ncbi:ALB3.1 [Scenedesmus sp. PABB004]|nr:ALB3.1 [Scenedesmus sp. PABB004]